MKHPLKYELDGKSYYLQELADIFHVTIQCVYIRLRRGWTLQDFEKGYRNKTHYTCSFRQKWQRLRFYANKNPGYVVQEYYDDFEAYKSFLIKIGWKEGYNIFRNDVTKPLSLDNYYLSDKKKMGDSNVSSLAKQYGISHQAVYGRLRAGWTEEDFKRGYKSPNKKSGDPEVRKLMKEFSLSYKKASARLKNGWTPMDFKRGYKTINPNKLYFEKYTIQELCLKFGLGKNAVRSRIRYGWTLQDFERGYRKNRGRERRTSFRATLNTFILNYLLEQEGFFKKVIEKFISKNHLESKDVYISEDRQTLNGTEYVDYYVKGGECCEPLLRIVK